MHLCPFCNRRTINLLDDDDDDDDEAFEYSNTSAAEYSNPIFLSESQPYVLLLFIESDL